MPVIESAASADDLRRPWNASGRRWQCRYDHIVVGRSEHSANIAYLTGFTTVRTRCSLSAHRRAGDLLGKSSATAWRRWHRFAMSTGSCLVQDPGPHVLAQRQPRLRPPRGQPVGTKSSIGRLIEHGIGHDVAESGLVRLEPTYTSRDTISRFPAYILVDELRRATSPQACHDPRTERHLRRLL